MRHYIFYLVLLCSVSLYLVLLYLVLLYFLLQTILETLVLPSITCTIPASSFNDITEVRRSIKETPGRMHAAPCRAAHEGARDEKDKLRAIPGCFCFAN